MEERGEEDGRALKMGRAAAKDMLRARRGAQDEPDDARRAESIVPDSDGKCKIKTRVGCQLARRVGVRVRGRCQIIRTRLAFFNYCSRVLALHTPLVNSNPDSSKGDDMPRTSRRTPANRRANSEDIEEDVPTQDHPMEGVESDEDTAPRPSGKKRNGVASGSSQKKNASLKNEKRDSDESDDDDEVIDVNSFKDQPIQKAQAKVLDGLAADWKTCDYMVRQNWNVLQKIGEGLADVADDNEEPKVRELLEFCRGVYQLTCSALRPNRKSLNWIISCASSLILAPSSRAASRP